MKFTESIRTFFFAPASAKPFAALRLGLSSVLLVQLYFSLQVFSEIYGAQAYLQSSLQIFFTPPVFELHAFASVLSRWGITSDITATFFLIAYGVSLVLLGVGLFTRTAAFLAWALHFVLFQGQISSYGIDSFAQIFLFYVMLAPSGKVWSVDAYFDHGVNPLMKSSVVLRMAQIHLAIAYLTSGIEKGVGPQWWDGEAIWRSLMLPIYNQYDFGWLASVPWVSVVLGWGTLVLEAGYPVFMFWPKSRKVWLVSILSLHMGIALFLGLHLFGILMATLSFSLFGVSAFPERARAKSPVSDPLFSEMATA